MTRAIRRTTPPRRGMTLIEVLMALVILTGALLGMGRFITNFSHATSDGTLTSTAADLVLDRLEYLKATRPYSALSSYDDDEEDDIPGYPDFTRTTKVLRTNNAQYDYTAVTVTVSHPSLSAPVKKSTIIAAY